jgi:hypothetical protein
VNIIAVFIHENLSKLLRLFNKKVNAAPTKQLSAENVQGIEVAGGMGIHIAPNRREQLGSV